MTDFEKWWEHYPRKIAKVDAKRAWAQTEKNRPALEKMIRALIVAKSSEQWIKDGGMFIPYAGTYLRGERWDDVHEVELAGVVNGKMWWDGVGGIEHKARELGIKVDDYPSWPHFKAAVFKAAGVTPMKKTA